LRCVGASKFRDADWQAVDNLIHNNFSPVQVLGRMALENTLRGSQKTIYQHIYEDKRAKVTAVS
jgi:IS30 family transposase